MKMEDIERLMKLIQKSPVNELVWSEGDSKLVLKKAGEPQPVMVPPVQNVVSTPPVEASVPVASEKANQEKVEAVASGLHNVTSPMVGTYYASSSPDAKPYVQVGDQVTKGQVICIVEAMKLMNEIECDASGIVKEICVKNEAPVEFGTVLLKIAEN